MAKILFDREWYEELAPTSLYENDFELIVYQNAGLLYPNLYAVPFKKTVYSSDGSCKPDLALIDKEYRAWWIVEIEMSHHSLISHVIPQVKVLSQAAYGKDEAEYLCNQLSILNLTHVIDMMKGNQPKVLVIVNAPCPEWVEPLDKHEAKIAIFEIFRSDRNKYIFRINGEHPTPMIDVVSECEFDPLLPRFLTIKSPAILPVKKGENLKIYFENCITEWERIDVHDKVWLSPVHTNPLNKNLRYELVRHKDGTLTIRTPRNFVNKGA